MSLSSLGGDGCIIRNASLNDIDAVYDIEKNGSHLWSRDFFVKELGIGFSRFIVAQAGGRIIAFAVAWDVGGDLELLNIGVSAPFRRQGIGTRLIGQLVSLAHPHTIYVELKEKNNTAYHFYVILGFRKTGVRKNYYADDNAVLMEKVITP